MRFYLKRDRKLFQLNKTKIHSLLWLAGNTSLSSHWHHHKLKEIHHCLHTDITTNWRQSAQKQGTEVPVRYELTQDSASGNMQESISAPSKQRMLSSSFFVVEMSFVYILKPYNYVFHKPLGFWYKDWILFPSHQYVCALHFHTVLIALLLKIKRALCRATTS